ncbi:nitrogen regulation protein NR(II) [Magnetovirga frankeli]|uniref:nitrogen regulation protein NR(II) n=1 Tax=Magnetovirga frankeli TaxID=947516 RepID=UPI00129398F1|nr:nitrogen regulation protein NR(II) [gamma proteobacterium SS-5]
MQQIEQGILDNLNSSILLFDAQLRLLYINPAGEMLFAASSKVLLGRSVDQLLSSPRPGKRQRLCLSMSRNRPFTERGLLLQLADGQEIRVDCTATPLQDKVGSQGLLVELQQVDRQMRISKEEQLISQQKAAAAVVRNLAHEVKNPLGGLRGAAQLLQQELHDPSQREYTQVIIEEADRLQALVNKLLGPNKLPAFTRVNIHQVLERVRQLILAESAQSIEVQREYDPSIPEFMAEPDLLIQALLNIAGNAARAVGENGHIRFRTRVQRQYTIGNQRHRLVLQVDIQDDGPGIAEDLQEKIFFPMVSGHAGGVGIGLSIAQSLISQHGGLIECASRPGETTFTLLLPLEPVDA